MAEGHGAVVVGKRIEEITMNAIVPEVAAKLQLFASPGEGAIDQVSEDDGDARRNRFALRQGMGILQICF